MKSFGVDVGVCGPIPGHEVFGDGGGDKLVPFLGMKSLLCPIHFCSVPFLGMKSLIDEVEWFSVPFLGMKSFLDGSFGVKSHSWA